MRPSPKQTKQIFNAGDIRRILIRMAHEITEHNQGIQQVILVGIRQRGHLLAERLADFLLEIEGQTVQVGQLDTSIGGDEGSLRSSAPLVHHTSIPEDLADCIVVLVDDVLYTGRTVHAALNALLSIGRPEGIQLAVLIDRGHHGLPVRADFVGRDVPTSRNEHIEVHLQEVDGMEDEVIIVRPDA